MQSFSDSLYLYIVKTIRHLLLLCLVCWVSIVRAGDVYAVIVSGGRSRMFNHERYWNDCAFLYLTLRQDLLIPKERITLLMADGDSPANDMLLEKAAGFASSSVDLDDDGQADLTLAATRKNLEEAFQQLSDRLTDNDHLFIFITDHGEQDSSGEVHLWLWGSEQIVPAELAEMVGLCRPATINILLGQCHAGAFAEPLQSDRRIITAACQANQMSWACKERPYDEFVYHWTCAIAQHDEQGQPVNSDQNGDGHISMQEAFDYARQHDCRPETPSMTCSPVTLASQWSFDGGGAGIGIDGLTNLRQSHADKAVYDLQGRKIRE